MITRLLSTTRVGLALILIPITGFGGWAWWMGSRNWMPLELPISLSRGHIRTPEFKIDVDSTYEIQPTVEGRPDFEDGYRFPGVRFPAPLAMSWYLTHEGRIIASGKCAPTGGTPDFFYASKGRYALDLDIIQDGSRFNSGSPHLAVVEAGGVHQSAESRQTLLLWLLRIFVTVGICTLIRAAIVRRQENTDAFARVSSLTRPGLQSALTGVEAGPHVAAGPGAVPGEYETAEAPGSKGIYWRHHPSKPEPSNRRPVYWVYRFASVAAITYALVVIVMWVLQSWAWATPMGLRVHIMAPPPAAQRVPGMQPLLVQMRSHSPFERPDLYVESQPVAWEDFDKVLRIELNRRPPDWPVYLEGDPDAEWGYVGNAVDKIRGSHAEVVLLTPKAASPRSQSGSKTAPGRADAHGVGER